MREWLSGGVSPCQGEGRGFESRLALFLFVRNLEDLRGCGFFCLIGNCDFLESKKKRMFNEHTLDKVKKGILD